MGLVGLTQDDDGVTATLTTGETVRATWLVGADGGRSTVRKTLRVPFPGVTDESIRMLLGDVAADGLDREHVHWFGERAATPRTGIVLSPLPGTDQFQFGAPLDGEPTLDGLQALVDRFTAGVRLHDLTWSTVWRPNVRLAERFRVGRVFLAGDAAARAPAHRRPGPQHRRAGRLQPRLEARRRFVRAARHLRDRAPRRRRGRAGPLHADHEEVRGRRRRRPRAARRGPAAGAVVPDGARGRARRGRPRPRRPAASPPTARRSGCSTCSAARTPPRSPSGRTVGSSWARWRSSTSRGTPSPPTAPRPGTVVEIRPDGYVAALRAAS